MWISHGRTAAGLLARDTYLNQILAFRFGHQRLKLWGCEGVDEPGFRHDEEEYLGAGENGQLICLTQTRRISLDSVTDKISLKSKPKDATTSHAQLTFRKPTRLLTFFMIPALRFENVM